MFRRRGVARRRHLERQLLPGRRNRVVRGALRQLRRANRMMGDGDFAGAAAIFDFLADGAQSLGMWHGPQLFLEAGRAWMMAGEATHGLDRLRHGLRLMPEMGQSYRLPLVLSRIVRELRDRGFQSQANELDREFKGLLGGVSDSPLPVPATSPMARLPAQCPQCGGSVLPNEVEWADRHSAICDYCGSLIQAEA